MMTFSEIETICKEKIDHSLLLYKKELLNYGYEIDKISLKNQTVKFKKI